MRHSRSFSCLMSSLNRGGFSADEENAGSGLFFCTASPFVMVRAHQVLLARLESKLDLVSPPSGARLCFRWSLQGSFREGFLMDWRLAVCEPLSGWWPNIRRRLDADFVVMAGLVDEVVEGRFNPGVAPGYMP